MRFSHCGRSISGRGYSGRTFSGSTLSAQTVLILSPAGFHWANPAEAAANAAIRSAIFFICIIFRFGRGGKLRRCALFETWFQVSCKARRLSTVFFDKFSGGAAWRGNMRRADGKERGGGELRGLPEFYGSFRRAFFAGHCRRRASLPLQGVCGGELRKSEICGAFGIL